MINIYIDVNKREVTIKDRKDKIVNKYSNISTKNKEGLSKSLKLFMYSLNKIFLDSRYNDKEYLFNINDCQLLNIIKLENDNFRETVNKEWHDIYDKNIVSQLGTFLHFLSKINAKNILYWERDELFELKDKKQVLYTEQSKYDVELQNILHSIDDIKTSEITPEKAYAILISIKEVRNKRINIKKKIKKIEREERCISYDK